MDYKAIKWKDVIEQYIVKYNPTDLLLISKRKKYLYKDEIALLPLWPIVKFRWERMTHHDLQA